MDLDKLKRAIEKKAKGVHVSKLSESNIASTSEYIKTPALDLNRILSGSLSKGIPVKGLLCLAGPEHSFKSSMMILSMVEAQKQGFTPIIFDTEGAISSEFCLRWGLDVENCLYVYSSFIDNLFPVLAQLKDSEEERFAIGLDSIGGLELYKIVEDSLKGEAKVDPGNLAKWIRRLLKLILNICISKNSVGIVTAHIYSSPDMYTKDSIGGGNAVRLFPNIIVSFKKKEVIEGTGENRRVVGTKITATTMKNRFYPPFQQAIIDIDFNKGINQYAGILDLCVAAGLIVKAGAGYYKDLEGNNIARGDIEAEEVLRKDFPTFLPKIDEWLKTTGYSTVNKELELMTELAEEIEEEKSGVETEVINTTEEVEEEKPKKTRKKKNGQKTDTTEES